jgi:hypothetical protein
MKRLILLVAVLVAGCTTTAAPQAGASPSESVPPASSATPRLDRSPCRIPIASVGFTVQAGFVSYPDGSFTPDSGAKAPAPAEPGVPDGGFGMTYDRQFAKWLPVPPNWVAPDERRYAYGTLYSMNNVYPTNLSLHVVDVAKGSVKSVAPGDWLVVAFDVKGVYVMRQSSTQAASGLSLINPDTGAIRHITDAGFWTYVSGDAAWGTVGFILGAQAQPQLDHLIKLDLASGRMLSGTTAAGGNGAWFTRAGTTIGALGGDNRSDVIVQATNELVLELWLVGAQTGIATKIYSGSSQGLNSLVSGNAYGDGHGVWLGTQAGLYLYPYGGAITKIASNPGQVAGICS